MLALGLVLMLMQTAGQCRSISTNATALFSLDDFSVDQPSLTTTTETFQWNAVNGSTIVGGERDMILDVTAATPSTGCSCDVSNNKYTAFSYYQGDALGNYTVQYDGPDNSSDLSVGGLGGIDFTKDGGNALLMDLYTSSLQIAFFHVYVYSPDGSVCTWTNREAIQGIASVLYGQFHGDCDWTNVGAVEFVTNTAPAPSLTLSSLSVGIDTGVPTPPNPPPLEMELEFDETVVVIVPPHSTLRFHTPYINSQDKSSITMVAQSSDESACLYERYAYFVTPTDYDSSVCASSINPMVIEVDDVGDGYYYGTVVTQGVYTTIALALFSTG